MSESSSETNNSMRSTLPDTRKSLPVWRKTPNNKRPSSSAPNKDVVSYLEDPECIQLRQMTWDNADFRNTSDELLGKYLVHLREFAAYSAGKEDFASAKKATAMCSSVKDVMVNRSSKGDHYVAKLKKNENSASIIMSKHQMNLKNVVEKYEKRRQILEKRHELETERFETDWRDNKPQKFRKPSLNLLQLKQIEKSLIRSGEYDRAEAVNNQIKELVAVETEEAQKNLAHQYKIAKAKLIESQKAEFDLLQQEKEKEIQFIELERSQELALVETRKAVLRQKSMERSKPLTRSVFIKASKIAHASDGGELVLLPPLQAPNDPVYIEEEERKQKEIIKKKKEFQQKNQSNVLSRYKPRDEIIQNYAVQTNSQNSPAKTFETQISTTEQKDQTKNKEKESSKIQTINNSKNSIDDKSTGKPKPVEQKPIEQPKPVEEKPIEQPKPVEEKPIEQPKPVEEKPIEQPKPVEEKPIEQPKPVEEKPIEQPKPVEEKPIEQPKPVEQKPIEQPKPVEEKPIEQPKPVEEKPIEQPKPVEEKPIEQPKPVEEKPIEQPKPVEEKPIEQPKPVEEKPVEEKVIDKLVSLNENSNQIIAQEPPITEKSSNVDSKPKLTELSGNTANSLLND